MTDEKTISGPVRIVGTYNPSLMSLRIIPPPVFSLTVENLTLDRFLVILGELGAVCNVTGTCSIDVTISTGETSVGLPKMENGSLSHRGTLAFNVLLKYS